MTTNLSKPHYDSLMFNAWTENGLPALKDWDELHNKLAGNFRVKFLNISQI